MAEEILFDYIVDQPYIPVSNPETGLKLLLKINASNALRQDNTAQVRGNLVLVLDVSSSMKTRELREVKEAAKSTFDQLRPGDVVSVIAFQSVVYEIVPPTVLESASQIAAMKQRIDVIDSYQGGGTNMEYAIEKAEEQLNLYPDPGMARKIILFTDGQVTGLEDNCLQAAQRVSSMGITFDALGFGPEFDYAFMQNLVSYSNGYTEKIDRPDDIRDVFKRRVESLTNSIATNCSLQLTFTPAVRAGRGYRYAPEMNYLGNIRLPGETRSITIPMGTIEKDKEYSYLITCTVPQREPGNMRVIKADLTYDIPSMNIVQETSTQSVVVQYSDDPTQVAQISGEVERVFDEVEIGRLVEQLDRATKQQDHKRSALFFDILAKRYEELGDTDMQQHYAQLKAKYVQDGALSQEDMNYTRHRSTQRRETSVQLIDASDLI